MHKNPIFSPNSFLSAVTAESTSQDREVNNDNLTTFVNPSRISKPNHHRDASSQPLSSWESRAKSIFDAEIIVDSDMESSGYRTIENISAIKAPQRYKSPSTMRSPQPSLQPEKETTTKYVNRNDEGATTTNTKGSTVLKVFIDSGASLLNYSVSCAEVPQRHTQVTTTIAYTT